MDEINSDILCQFSSQGLTINEGIAIDARLVKSASHPISNKEMNDPAASGGVSKPLGAFYENLNNLSCFIRVSVSFLVLPWFRMWFLIVFSDVASPTVPMYLPSLQNSPPQSSSLLSLGNLSNILLTVIDLIVLTTRSGHSGGGPPQKT
jgi:hypothetical protein